MARSRSSSLPRAEDEGREEVLSDSQEKLFAAFGKSFNSEDSSPMIQPGDQSPVINRYEIDNAGVTQSPDVQSGHAAVANAEKGNEADVGHDDEDDEDKGRGISPDFSPGAIGGTVAGKLNHERVKKEENDRRRSEIAQQARRNQKAHAKGMRDGRLKHILKIIVVGDAGVGKTSLIQRFVYNTFNPEVASTVGAEFSAKELHSQQYRRTLHLQLWDIAGQERSRVLTRSYYKDAAAAVVVVDVNNPEAIVSAFHWKREIDEQVLLPDGSPIPALLLASKCDLLPKGNHGKPAVNDSAVVRELAKPEGAKGLGFSDWALCSAKEDIQVTPMLMQLADEAFTKQPPRPSEKEFIRLKQRGYVHESEAQACGC